MKTKQYSEVIEDSDGKKLVLKCDNKTKEERIKCEEECKNDIICARFNVGLKHRDAYCERKKAKLLRKLIVRKI